MRSSWYVSRRFFKTLTATALLSSLILAAPSKALPIYTDTLWFDDPAATEQNAEAARKSAQLKRLSGYIQETFKVSGQKSQAIVSEAISHAQKHKHLQPELILAVIAVESTFKTNAVSHAGARGLMQILPKAHPKKVKAIGGVKALFNPKKNIATGVKILNEYLKLSKGDMRKALLRYNGSLKMRNPPYAKKVMRMYNKFKRISDSASIS